MQYRSVYVDTLAAFVDNAFQYRAGARFFLHLYAGLMVVFLLLPTIVVIPMSFSAAELLEFPPSAWSTKWWGEFFRSPTWTNSTTLSVLLATMTMMLALPIGLGAAYASATAGKRTRLVLNTLLILPAVVPPILIAIGIFFVYARLGLNGTFLGLLLGHTLIALPIVFVVLRAAFANFDFDQERAARSLGASWQQSFFRVVLPQIRLPIFSAALLAFLTSLDEVIISMFVGSGSNTTLTKVMFLALRDRIDPVTAVISSMWTILVFVFVLMIYWKDSWSGAKKRRSGDVANAETVPL